jgi:hypothetical protein
VELKMASVARKTRRMLRRLANEEAAELKATHGEALLRIEALHTVERTPEVQQAIDGLLEMVKALEAHAQLLGVELDFDLSWS